MLRGSSFTAIPSSNYGHTKLWLRPHQVAADTAKSSCDYDIIKLLLQLKKVVPSTLSSVALNGHLVVISVQSFSLCIAGPFILSWKSLLALDSGTPHNSFCRGFVRNMDFNFICKTVIFHANILKQRKFN